MKMLIAFMTLSMSSTALAQGAWMIQPEPAAQKVLPVAVEPAATQDAPVAVPLPKPRPTPSPVVAAKPAPVGLPDGCTSAFDLSAKYFKAALGNDVKLAEIGEFEGTFKKFKSKNALWESGSYLMLKMTLLGQEIDLPTKICKRGKVLTAQLVTSMALKGGTSDPHPTIVGMVETNQIPGIITLDITRKNNNLVFHGKTGETEITAAASVR